MTNAIALVLLTLAWQYPSNSVTDDLSFIIRQGTNASQSWTNWPVVTNRPATNCQSSRGNFTNQLAVAPGRWFWVVQASNFWGGYGQLSLTSNIALTPPLPSQPISNSISR